MAEDSIPISEFSVYLTDLIEKEARNQADAIDEILHRRSLQLRGRIRDLSRTKFTKYATGEYASGWRVRTVQRNHEKVRVIYNAKKPWLTYILEYVTRHQQAVPHIRPALEETIDAITEELIGQI